MENALVFSRTRHGADRVVRDLGPGGHRCRRHPRGQDPERPAGRPGQLQARREQGAGGHGHCRPGHRHCRAEPRRQLRPAQRARGLRAPHWPHRPGGPHGQGHQLFCCIDEIKQLGQIEKLIRRRLPVKESPWPMEVTTPSETQAPYAPSRQGGPSGQRPARQARPSPGFPQNAFQGQGTPWRTAHYHWQGWPHASRRTQAGRSAGAASPGPQHPGQARAAGEPPPPGLRHTFVKKIGRIFLFPRKKVEKALAQFEKMQYNMAVFPVNVRIFEVKAWRH